MFRKVLKQIEIYNKWLILFILKVFLRNKPQVFPVSPQQVKKLLLLRYDVLGDMVITLPMIHYLQQYLPDTQIDILCTNRNNTLAEHTPGLKNIYLYSRKKLFFKELRPLRKEKYDMIISLVFNRTTIAGLIANYINRKAIKVHLKDSDNVALYSILFNVLLPFENIRFKITLLELQVRMAAMLFGVDFKYEDIKKDNLILSNDLLTNALNLFSETSQIKIIYNISAGAEHRQFSTIKNITILKHLTESLSKCNFYVSCSPNDIEKAKSIVLGVDKPNCRLAIHSSNVMQSFAIIQLADFVITPDTAFVQIASMFNIPTIIFYSTLTVLPDEWLPYRNKYTFMVTKEKTSIEELDNNEIIRSIIDFINK
ncbi:MAG TPA: hypothetical protein PLE30_03750 [Candidatus Kapabacteria bacterium]|nr:hypothetical protein [Candidatus Kapabacteria bacterium]